MSLPLEEGDDDDNALRLLDEHPSKIVDLNVAKQRYKSLHEDKRRKVDYFNRLDKKASQLDKALAKERDEVESLKRTLELELQKDEADAESRKLERDQKTEKQEGRIRDYLSDVLYRKPPPPKAKNRKEQVYELDTVLISFIRPNDNIRYNLPFRVDNTTTLHNLRKDACAYWDVDTESFILKTMANSKCQNEISVQKCFKRGEIAQLRLEEKNKEQPKITEAEEKAIQPRKQKSSRQRERAQDMVDAVMKFTDKYRSQLQKLGGIYFLLKLRDLKPSEHVAKIKPRDFFMYSLLALITILCYSYQRNSGEQYWFLEGIEDAITQSVLKPNLDSSSTSKYVPSFMDLRSFSDVYDFLQITLPYVIWGASGAENLHTYNQLVGYLSIRQKLVRTPNPAWQYCTEEQAAVSRLTNASCPATFVQEDTQRISKLGTIVAVNVTTNASNTSNATNTTTYVTDIEQYWTNVLNDEKHTDFIRGPAKPYEYVTDDDNSDLHQIGTVHGQLQTYTPGGYSVEYKMDKIPSTVYDENVQFYKTDMSVFKDLGWIHPWYTRLLVIDFTIYNYNYDMWGACELIIEFPPSGNVMPLMKLRSFVPNLFETSHDYSVMYIMAARVLIGIYILIGVGSAEIKHKTKNQNAGILYYCSLNGICDVGIVVTIIASMIVRLVLFSGEKTTDLFDTLQDETRTTGSKSFNDLSVRYEWLYIMEGIIFFFTMLRLVSLFRLNRSVYLLWHTVGIAVKQAFYLCTVFVPSYFFFMLVGHRVWGARYAEFRTLAHSFMSVFHMLKGEVEVETMIEGGAASAAIFYIGLYVFVTFLLFSGFAMVFAESYYVVQLTVATQQDKWAFWQWKKWFISPVVISLVSFVANPGSGSSSQSDTGT